jgi:hypothetical protein
MGCQRHAWSESNTSASTSEGSRLSAACLRARRSAIAAAPRSIPSALRVDNYQYSPAAIAMLIDQLWVR